MLPDRKLTLSSPEEVNQSTIEIPALQTYSTEKMDGEFKKGGFWIRQVKRLTYQDLSDATGYSVSYLHLIEHGSRRLTLKVRETIAQALGFDGVAIALAGLMVPRLIDAVTAKNLEERLDKLHQLHELVDQMRQP